MGSWGYEIFILIRNGNLLMMQEPEELGFNQSKLGFNQSRLGFSWIYIKSEN